MSTYIKSEAFVKQKHYFDKARLHFRFRQFSLQQISNTRSTNDWLEHNLYFISGGWDIIKKLTMWSYDVSLVADMPDNKKEEANKLAIRLIDETFDQYEKIWLK